MTIETTCTWNEKLNFQSVFGHHVVHMDAKKPIGSDKAPTPKELLLASICGCTAMDVVSLLRKAKVSIDEFRITATAETAKSHPAVFTQVHLRYLVNGSMDSAPIMDAVQQSMNLYCGVSAMIAKACPITYEISINGTNTFEGQAQFTF